MILWRSCNKKTDYVCKESCRGRSMVEMLGVLTVLAILSIGGIYGYRVAMNKYMANVLIGEMNDVSLHITLHLMKGNVRELMLPKPYNAGKLQRTEYKLEYGCRGGTSVSAPCLGVHSYFVQISGVPYRACYEARPLLRHLKWTDTMYINDVVDGECSRDQDNTILSVFNIDGFVAEGTGIPFDPIDKNKSCDGSADCGYTDNSGLQTAVCVNGHCVGCITNEDCSLPFVCNKETGICEYLPNRCSSDAECVQKNPEKPFCSGGNQCVACYQENQCVDGKICHTESAGCFSDSVKVGVCLSSGKQTIKADQTYLYFAGVPGSWWDAKRWCSENGYKMVTLKDLGCVDIKTGVCLDANGQLPKKLQAIQKELKKELNAGSTCVVDRKTACLSYKVDLSSGEVTTNPRNSGCNVLCR